MKRLKIILAFLLIFLGLSSNVSFANNITSEEIEQKIVENNEIRRKKIETFINQKLDNFEQKETYSSLPDSSKVMFYEKLKTRINDQKEKIKNKNKKEIYDIFWESVEKRLLEFQNPNFEEQWIFLELLSNE